LTAVQLQPAAFGQSLKDASPNVQFNAREAVAQAVRQSQTTPAAAARINTPAASAWAPHQSNTRKWVLIAAAAVGAGIAIAMLKHDRIPTIVAGATSVVALFPILC